MPMHAVTWTS
ncbi:hypothetical protein V565_132380 [Rhizoctonia solani 123E]|uniref:Uncharacterized protein n=1 Tax=Rhizoctonia solani 123E TaxID=1423351 RepID=A0A074SDN0_9AGAM|nr:hypothetical protein V565_132380 [Rhizoctonia solani 123E]